MQAWSYEKPRVVRMDDNCGEGDWLILLLHSAGRIARALPQEQPIPLEGVDMHVIIAESLLDALDDALKEFRQNRRQGYFLGYFRTGLNLSSAPFQKGLQLLL